MRDAGSLSPGEDIKKSVWFSMLDAELEAKYWEHLCRHYYKWNNYVRMLLAITSSGVVGGWVSSWAASSRPWDKVMEIAWKILSGISAAIATAIPILNWQRDIDSMSRLSTRWLQIQTQYEILWTDIESGLKNLEDIVGEYKQIKAKESLYVASADLQSNKVRVKEKCFNEILESRGLV